jgi:uncharacterized protein (TIGR04255 family)
MTSKHTRPTSFQHLDWPPLKTTPIVEALLELRFEPTEAVTMEQIEAFATDVAARFPIKKPVYEQSFEFTIEPPTASHSVTNMQPVGLDLRNTAKNRVLLPRVDRFTTSYLPPYVSWPALLEDLKTYYETYNEHVPRGPLRRLGMRYINRAEITFVDGRVDLDEYLKTGPRLPTEYGLEDAVAGYDSTVVIPIPTEDQLCGARIHYELPEPQGATVQAMILDIDVFYVITEPLEWDAIAQRFEVMRQARNAIFFGTFTDKALASYR